MSALAALFYLTCSVRLPPGVSVGGSDVGPSSEAPARELVESGFALEIADAPLLHDGLNMADLAHLLVLAERGVIPPGPAARGSGAILDVVRSVPAEDFPYDPGYGDAYNSREAYFVQRLRDGAARLQAGRPPRG